MTNKPRLLFFDIEATNLAANFGYILCIAWKWEDQKRVQVASIADAPSFRKQPTNDKWLIETFRPILEEADVICGHYAQRFDMPFLQTRALYHGLAPLPQLPLIDTWRVARDRLKLNSNRLASLAAALGVEEKTALLGPTWIEAMAGHEGSIDYVVKHCKQDVVVLEQVYQKIKGLRSGPMRLGSREECPSCGSHSIQARGQIKTLLTKKQRFSCNDCGRWFQK